MASASQTSEALPVYSLESSIAEFFALNSKATRQQCDDLARALLSSTSSPVSIQGSFSYTVVGGTPPKIVQFRLPSSDLDVECLRLAHAIHGEVVARMTSHGSIGEPPSLSVYVIEKLPGVTYIEACLADGVHTAFSSEQHQRQKNTVVDLASFYAAAWKAPQRMDIKCVEGIFTNKLQMLARDLPSRFTGIVRGLETQLSLIFSSEYPCVLTHGDLCEMNILVDQDSGHLTGVIDWAEADILPFGCALWGMKNLLGFMDGTGWHYFPVYRELEDLFWRTFQSRVNDNFEEFWPAVQVAQRLGIFLRYGFSWVEGSWQRVTNEADSDMKYLDAFITTS